MARHGCADLFLDTMPCNAHTTATDALSTGLPVLTCQGETFAGRVASSLLHAAGVPELITTSLADYETMARRLATEPEELGRLKAKLRDGKTTCPLFDLDRFARTLETAYAKAHERHCSGLPPASFDV